MSLRKKIVASCPVNTNVRLGADVYKMMVEAPDICRAAKAGQFVQVKTGRPDSPLLRRPLSIADFADDELTIVYRTVGLGTQWLSERRAGDPVDIVGPLGRGFTLEANRPLLVGGGVGLAPLLSVARFYAERGRADILLAGRSRGEVVFWEDLFRDWCSRIHITTDDGSLGVHGNALALLPGLADSGLYDFIYACGPSPMLTAIIDLVKGKNIACQVSLESRMGCGLGVCWACAVTGADHKRKKICLNGPVFWAGEVDGL
jgi:dihydroorotate dehydrogenase electron transfer subunit